MRLGGSPKSKQNRSGAETSGHRTSFDRGNMHRERAGLLHNRGALALFHIKNCESSCGRYPGTNERQHDLEIKMESAIRKASLLSQVLIRRANAPFELHYLFEPVGHSNETHVRTQSVSREPIILFFVLHLETASPAIATVGASTCIIRTPPSSLQVRRSRHFRFV